MEVQHAAEQLPLPGSLTWIESALLSHQSCLHFCFNDTFLCVCKKSSSGPPERAHLDCAHLDCVTLAAGQAETTAKGIPPAHCRALSAVEVVCLFPHCLPELLGNQQWGCRCEWVHLHRRAAWREGITVKAAWTLPNPRTAAYRSCGGLSSIRRLFPSEGKPSNPQKSILDLR